MAIILMPLALIIKFVLVRIHLPNVSVIYVGNLSEHAADNIQMHFREF